MSPGILFDLDETLLDRSASITKYATELYRDLAERISVSPDTFMAEFIRLDGNGYIPRETFFESLANYLSVPEATIAAHFAENAWNAPVLMSGAEQGLQKLRDKGVPTGIITNGGSNNQRKKLSNTGLAQLVDHVLISEEFGAKKPDSSIFLAACRALGIDPAACWYVGDNPTVDIMGASAVGLHTVWLRRSLPWPEDQAPCYSCVVSSLEDAFDAILCDA